MKTPSKYISKHPDSQGVVSYTKEENAIWRDLIARQDTIIQGRACDEYIEGLKTLDLPRDRVPQLSEVNSVLLKTTGWSVAPVPALIGFHKFFGLLADKKFPAATFIRTREDFDYIKEPDIFHEVYGHCPLLTNPVYAEFMCEYGKIAMHASDEDHLLLARLYWFTVEFGLINTKKGLRIYGGGVLSSQEETIYAVESIIPKRIPLIPLEALRTPYRIDILQLIYWTINDFNELYDLTKINLIALINTSRELGQYAKSW